MTVTRLVTTPDSASTPNATGAFTPTAGDLLVVVLVSSASVSDADDVPTASANGITFVRAVTSGYSTNSHDVYVANQLVPASPVSMTVSWAPSDVATSTVIDVYAVTGMARVGADAIRQSDINSGAAAGTPEITFPANCLTGSVTIVSVGNLSAPAGVTEPADWTEINDTNCTVPTAGLEVAYRLSGFTGTTVTWQSTSATIWSAVGVELDTSVPPIAVSESSWTANTTPRDVVVPGCLTDDRLIVLVAGNQISDGDVTACTTTTQAGSTGVWTEPQEDLGEGWVSSATALVTADGSVTVRVSRTINGAAAWGFYVVRARGFTGGIGASGKTTGGSGEVVNLAVSADSAVVFISSDWSASAVGTGWTPTADVTLVERAVENAEYTAHAAYWQNQTAGTRDYGSTGAAGTAIRCIAIELKASSGTNANVTETQASTGTANNPSPKLSPVVGTGTGTGTADNTTSQVKPGSGIGTGTGTANNPSPAIKASAGVATGAGVAENATVNTGGPATNASAGLASGTGTADNASTKIEPVVGLASATGAANNTTATVKPTPVTATGTGTANNPIVQTGSFTNAQAGLASGTGAANTTTSKTAPIVSTATASGVANNPTVTVGAVTQAGLASGTGTASNPTVTIGRTAFAQFATATGTADSPNLAVRANVEAAVALGQAFDGDFFVGVVGGVLVAVVDRATPGIGVSDRDIPDVTVVRRVTTLTGG